MSYEKLMTDRLGIKVLNRIGGHGGGDICDGQGYQTENEKIYVKTCSDSLEQTKKLFNGEFQSLKAIQMTNSVKVPKPIDVLHNPTKDSYFLVTEYLDICSLSTKYAASFGTQLAKMHSFNEKQLSKLNSSSIHDKLTENDAVTEKFGFHVPTCCGRIEQCNEWMENWMEFYCQNKLQYQINLLEKDYGDRELLSLWSELQLRIPQLFKDVIIKPALVHGDMWSGNVGQVDNTPVLFDPSCFYGHSEFEFGIATIFSSRAFNKEFYQAYHEIIPKTPGFDLRQKLYQLFHYLNHWNHFGTGYRSSSISTIRSLLKK